MDLGLLYPALAVREDRNGGGKCDRRDAGTSGIHGTRDDLHYFPPYECAIVVRDDTLQRFPRLKESCATFGQYSDASMRHMNELVDVEHKPAAEVARDFLNQRINRYAGTL